MNEHGRLPWYKPHELDERTRELYDRITGGLRSRGPQAFERVDDQGRLHGPFNALLISPEVGFAVQELGAAIRFKTELTPRAREIAILELAVLRESEYEWYAHERVGAQIGLSAAEITALRYGEPAPTFSPTESLVRATVQVLARDRDLDDAQFTAISEALGESGVMDLIALVGYYELLALSLRVWRTPLPEGAEPHIR